MDLSFLFSLPLCASCKKLTNGLSVPLSVVINLSECNCCSFLLPTELKKKNQFDYRTLHSLNTEPELDFWIQEVNQTFVAKFYRQPGFEPIIKIVYLVQLDRFAGDAASLDRPDFEGEGGGRESEGGVGERQAGDREEGRSLGRGRRGKRKKRFDRFH